MHILITGGAGFVGSVLATTLIDRGHSIRIVDCGFFGLEHVDSRAEIIEGSILAFDPEWLAGVEAVVHLAGLSNDPMAAFSPSLNYVLNAGGSAIVAHAAKEAGIRRFVFASTCSVYGLDESGPLTEEHHVKPTFPYAISKLMAERMLGCLGDTHFRPIIMRKGTVVGWSPRMRFDLVTNAMVKSALAHNKIVVHNPALWRPLIDVEDACEAYVCALSAPLEVTGVFNISSRNFTLSELAKAVAAELARHGLHPSVETHYREDVRSYRVSTDKASELLKFHARKPMAESVSDIVTRVMDQPASELDHPKYYNIRQMERLISNGLLHPNGHTPPLNRIPAAAVSA